MARQLGGSGGSGFSGWSGGGLGGRRGGLGGGFLGGPGGYRPGEPPSCGKGLLIAVIAWPGCSARAWRSPRC